MEINEAKEQAAPTYREIGVVFSVQSSAPFLCTTLESIENAQPHKRATIHEEAMAKTRNLEEIRWTFIGKTTAINRSNAIQVRLCTET